MVRSTFPHGVTIREAQPQPQSVITLDEEKLVYVGSAPIHLLDDPSEASMQELKQVRSLTDVNRHFGPRALGYSIPDFYWVCLQYGCKEAYFVNIFDPATHTGSKAQVLTFDGNDRIDLGNLLEYSSIVLTDVTTVEPATQSWTDGAYDTGESAIANVIVQSADGNTTYTEEDYIVDGGVIAVTSWGAIDPNADTLIGYDRAGTTTHTITTDYTLTETTPTNPNTDSAYITSYTYNHVVIDGVTLTSGDKVFITYTHAHPKFLSNADAIGTVAGDGTRTGLQLLKEMRATFGFEPTHISADRFTEAAVVNALESLANDLRAQYHVTIPRNTTVSDAIAGRADDQGKVKNAFTSDPRANLYVDWVEVPDPTDAGGMILQPLHWHGMAQRYRTTRKLGFWWSISSQAIEGIQGIEVKRTMSREDPTADNQTLSEDGSYITIFYDYGLGYVFDGNHNAAHPSQTNGSQFAAVQNARDVILRSLKRSAQTAIDKPLQRTSALSLERRFNSYFAEMSNPDRAQGQAIGTSTASIDIPDNTASEQRLGRLYVLLQIAYLTPINTIVLIEEPIEIDLLAA
ncbi:MAG: hypothetical protein J7642_21325 [Cyanobacteria bacterium SBC]|nr:hypothetical protein [Cyanobacteria bacterium SBC]